MTTDTIQLSIPLDLLAKAFAGLTLRKKYQLLEILETQIAEAEEETWETDASIRHEIHWLNIVKMHTQNKYHVEDRCRSDRN